MKSLIAEHITYQLDSAPDTENLDQRFFVQIDPEKCTGCSDCKKHCPTNAIYGDTGLTHRIFHAEPCLHCGQCLIHCPAGAIYETCTWLDEVERRLAEPDTICIAMPAPSLRYSLGECFGLKPGANIYNQLLSALSALGFSHIWDTAFAADVTIWEEGTEFLDRLQNGGLLPQFSTCCSSWQKYVEFFQPEILPHMSSCKSPLAINGRLAKTYGADRFNYPPSKIYTVALMPCIAKKYEALRPELVANGIRDIDAVLTTRELAWLMQKNHLDLPNLPPGLADTLMGEAAPGVRFGFGGGVIQNIASFVWQKLTGNPMDWANLRVTRRLTGLIEYEMKVLDKQLRFAALCGGDKFEEVCTAVKNGALPWHFIEFMACPKGCINGGGQPLLPAIIHSIQIHS